VSLRHLLLRIFMNKRAIQSIIDGSKLSFQHIKVSPEQE
jgi:hypothetical protein